MRKRSVAGSYASFLARIPSFIKAPLLTLEDARARIRRSFETRHETFLDLLERGVFGNPSSPYLPLLRLARCELGDIRRMVSSSGVEGTLRALRESGVWVSFEQFKGRAPIERDGHVFEPAPADFDNPLLTDAFVRSTGGSTGSPVPIRTSLADVEERCSTSLLAYEAWGVRGAPTATWRELPAGFGVVLQDARFGQRHERWFCPPLNWSLQATMRYRAFWAPVVAAARLAGSRLPMPRRAAPDDALAVVSWARERVASHGACLVRTGPSHALRAAVAAGDAGWTLEGVTFMGAGEPPTPAKVRRIEEVGARWAPNYTAMETSKVGIGCPRGVDGTDVHFMSHHTALVTHPRTVPGAEVTVDSFHFTTLRASAPKLLLNVELDDYGIVEERDCGCPLAETGWSTHLREIFSFSKLSGEGVTFVGTKMVHIIEEVLPARFGGTGHDYQFAEEEDDAGFTKLTLLVSPRVAIADEGEVVRAVLQALGDDNLARNVRAIWERAGTLRIRREEPRHTARGKVFPLVRRAGGAGR